MITLLPHLRSPLVRDLYESLHVDVRDSAEGGAGQGLWARLNIPRGQLCALFNGVREYREDPAYNVLEKNLINDIVSMIQWRKT